MGHIFIQGREGTVLKEDMESMFRRFQRRREGPMLPKVTERPETGNTEVFPGGTGAYAVQFWESEGLEPDHGDRK